MKVRIINKSKHPLPEYATPLSAGVDLRANIDTPITLLPLQRTLIPTGLFIALPEGYEAQVRPRSGLAAKHGITVDFPGFFIKDNAGAILTDIRVIGDANGTDQAHGFDVRPGAAMWFRRCVAENCSGSGIAMNSSSWVYILECSVKNSQENAFNLKNCNYLQLIDTVVEFTDANDVDGVYFDGGSYNLVQNLSVTNAGRNALTLHRTIRTACNDVVATDCKQYAVYDKGQNCSFSNISGPISSDRVH
jgi:dUTPase